MESMINQIRKIILITLLTSAIALPLFSSEPEKLWGISRTELINRYKLENYLLFKPEDNPEYSNRIIDFFSSMNPEERAVITIIKTDGSPVTDYCFFNEKLYSVTEDWGNLDKIKAHDLIKTLKDKYTEQSVEEKSPNIVYSYKKNKTKVLLYKKAIDERSVQIKIFYYSTDLFRMLISE